MADAMASRRASSRKYLPPSETACPEESLLQQNLRRRGSPARGVFPLMVVGHMGDGTMMAGTPSAVSSLTVEAPARQITRSAARITGAMS